MKVLYIAMVFFLLPNGGIEAVHNPYPFKSYKKCAKHVKSSIKKLGDEIKAEGFCIKALPSKGA